MNVIDRIAICLLVALALSSFAVQGISARQPNVILLMTDDQGYGDLSCHGNPILKTSNLDRLYSESIRFTDFHVSPFCTPTRAALMTGHYPGRTGAYRTSSGRTLMHTDEKTIADVFSAGGYVTGMVGKWHLGDNAPHRPQDRGFQDVVWHRCGGAGQAIDDWGNDYFDVTDERNGKFEKFDGYCTDVWFAEAMRFVEADKPVAAVRAKIQIAGMETESAVEPGTRRGVFEIYLPAGPTELTTFLYDKSGKAGGAYFTEVQSL